MMRKEFNPTRRNRNIGTAKAGHGQDNRLWIPWRGRPFWEDITTYSVASRMIQGSLISVVIEHTRTDSAHSCTVDDIATILTTIPRDDWRGLTTFVLRQAKRKEELISGVWGRLVYHTDLGRPQSGGTFHGPMVFLDAAKPEFVHWRKASMDRHELEELERLRQDGHAISRVGGRWKVQSNPDAIRNTQLYRTIPHEIGHWVDWLEKVERPGGDGLAEKYFARPALEREIFAHRYADTTRQRLTSAGIIPFPRIPLAVADALRPEDFHGA